MQNPAIESIGVAVIDPSPLDSGVTVRATKRERLNLKRAWYEHVVRVVAHRDDNGRHPPFRTHLRSVDDFFGIVRALDTGEADSVMVLDRAAVWGFNQIAARADLDGLFET